MLSGHLLKLSGLLLKLSGHLLKVSGHLLKLSVHLLKVEEWLLMQAAGQRQGEDFCALVAGDRLPMAGR